MPGPPVEVDVPLGGIEVEVHWDAARVGREDRSRTAAIGVPATAARNLWSLRDLRK
jgi:hypothetical protein